MDTNKMREQFEAALVTKLVRELCAKAPGLPADAAELIVRSQWLERKGDGYAAPVPDHGWWAWQASREAVAIDLPSVTEVGGLCGMRYWTERQVITAVEAEGLRVAP